jgi:Family of unknown function (DUF5335)
LLGLAYDPNDDIVEVALDGLDHLIPRPRELYIDNGIGSLSSLEIIDADGVKQIVKLRDPLMLPPPRACAAVPLRNMDAPAAANSIEVRIAEISQLFDSLDPFPFRDKDLDKEAEEFIVSWARELPVDQPLKIVVHLPQSQASTPEARELGPALTRYFDYRARGIDLDLRELFRVGRRALVIGVTVLFFSVSAGQTVAANASPHPVGRVVEESLLIFGWVANWRAN